MAKFIATIKATITRLVFAAHAIVAIWQVTIFKKNSFYWYLGSPILLLCFEGIFTLTIKENQEWKWFCPSVFLYLSSIVPAIWLLELDKVDRRLKVKEETFNLTASAGANLKEIHNLIGVNIKLPDIPLSTETWITLIEQFLMLILIIGRWMLPKGDLTRDQLSQLLLVYIGTAADIIEFFDSFKDDKVASEPILVLLTLAIWSWSLMQFTVVLTATKSRKSRLTTTGSIIKQSNSSCCTIDVWGIALNITLQDAPFLAFRLLLITHFKIISYMNVFFTCKNTLVILLQLYRLYVVYSEHRKNRRKNDNFELTNISIIAKPDMYRGATRKRTTKSRRHPAAPNNGDNRHRNARKLRVENSGECSYEQDHLPPVQKKAKNARKDTGYSTGSSHTSAHRHRARGGRPQEQRQSRALEGRVEKRAKRERRSVHAPQRVASDVFSEESKSDVSSDEKPSDRRKRPPIERGKPSTSVSTTTSDASWE